MTTLLFFLVFLMPVEDSNLLRTYAVVSEDQDTQIDAASEVFPKTLLIGDILYAKMTVKNVGQEPLEFVPFKHVSGGKDFRSVVIIKNTLNDFFRENIGRIRTSREKVDYVGLVRPQNNAHKIKLLHEETSVLGPQPIFVPLPDCYNDDFWDLTNFIKDVHILFRFSTTVNRCFVTVNQELKIKPRPAEELRLIKEWCDQTKWYNPTVMPEYLWPQDTTSPSTGEWKEFEEKLTPGTLRNYIRMIRSLVEIAQRENRGKRQKMFDEMLTWINELQPLEKEGLTKRAYEIVEKQSSIFGREITIPKDVPDPPK